MQYISVLNEDPTSVVPKAWILTSNMTFSNTLESINEAIQTLSTSGNVKEEERQELLEASQKLQQAAESPLDGVLSIVLGVSHN